MHAIKNLSKQVVLLRFNSGREMNLAPEARLEDVADSEVRLNRDLEKLHKLGFIELAEAGATRSTLESGDTAEQPAAAPEAAPAEGEREPGRRSTDRRGRK